MHSSEQLARYCMNIVLKEGLEGAGFPYVTKASQGHRCADVGAL